MVLFFVLGMGCFSAQAELQMVYKEQRVQLSKVGKTTASHPPEQVVLRIGTDYFYNG